MQDIYSMLCGFKYPINFLLGICIGSFINAFAYRSILFVYGKISFLNIFIKKSSCPKCKTNIKCYLNFPILGYLCTLGKCSKCKLKISIQYPLIELIFGLIFLFNLYFFKDNISKIIISDLFSFFAITLILTDIKRMLLPDILTLPLMFIGLILSYFKIIDNDFTSSAIAAISCIIILYGLLKIYDIIKRPIPFGEGDIKLITAFFCWFAYIDVVYSVMLASFLGIFYCGIKKIIFHKKEIGYIPFGPFLLLAIFPLFYIK